MQLVHTLLGDLMTIRNMVLLALAAVVFCGAAGAMLVPVALRQLVEHTPLEKCDRFSMLGDAWRLGCRQEAVRRQIERHGADAIGAIDRFAADDDLLEYRCHGLMHIEGRRVGARMIAPHEMQALVDTVGAKIAACSGGFVHGVFEGYVKKHGLAAADSVRFRGMCRGQDTQLARFNCAHGVGHAVMRELKMDVPSSVAFCSGLPGPDAGDCMSAVAMTLAEGVDFEGGPLAKLPSAKAMTSYCERLAGDVRQYCFRWLPLTVSFSGKATMAEVIGACTASTVTRSDRTACMVGLGRGAVAGRGRAICAPLSSNADSAACRYGLVVGLALNKPSLHARDLARVCKGESAEPCALAMGRMEVALEDKGYSGASCERTFAGPAAGRCAEGRRIAREPLDYSAAEQKLLKRASSTRHV